MTKQRFKLIPAVYLFLRRDDEILLLKRSNSGYQDGNYSVPAGHLDGGELAKAAIVREAKEEINIFVKEKDLKFVHLSHRLNGSPENERIDIFFECRKWTGQVKNNEPSKCSELKWCKITYLPSNMIPHVRIVLNKYLESDYYSEYPIEP